MKTKVYWWFLVVSSALCVLEALPIAMRGDPAGALGYMTGFAFFPFLVAYIARGRKGDWDSFSKWFFFGILICGSLTAQQQAKDWRSWSTDRMHKHMGEITQNAQAGHPNAAVADSAPFDAVMRGYYADVAGEVKTYEATTATIDVADIYTPKSFATMVGFHKSYEKSPMGALLKARCDWSASVIFLIFLRTPAFLGNPHQRSRGGD
jgi:hypothetical protein